ncbi:MAG: hypothetical protein KC933_18355 [Myxococcales bacterium]|nr:hypothetical protein [Myxococcales bacterium]MCB9651533.1 hypothetical protein [Deltaproteobacteria bacterium]
MFSARTLWTPALVALGLLAACSGSKDRPTGSVKPSNNDGGTNLPTTSCGNGVLNGTEACDGVSFAMGGACADLNLGEGALRCTATCTLDTSACPVRDYCTANNLYGDGQCDACELLGGVRDPDCDTVCGADGTCGDRYDTLTGTWTCRRLNLTDPDCGMCGNGVIDGNELCDQRAFADGKFTCESYGFLAGELNCKTDCTPNFASCTFSVCGDGTIEGPEQCEGTNFGADSCEARGFAGGNLTCNGCVTSEASCIAPGCGNDIVEPSLDEFCDGTSLGGATCESLGFAGGTLSCDGTCDYNTSACVAAGCGNGIIEELEECEGADLNGASCQSEGFLQGTLACSPSSCTYDTSGCIAPGCGNGIIESNEQCEGTDFGGASCQSLGFAAGDLICNSTCQRDTSMCVAAGCGNGIIETGEQCEGANLNGATCTSIGYQGGSLACDGSCQFDTFGCFGTRSFCGDGVKNGLEGCDGTDFGNLNTACSTYGLGTGTVSCHAATCRVMFDSCQTKDLCQAQGWYNDGYCDLCEYYSVTAQRDPDCGDLIDYASCGQDNVCGEYFDIFVGYFGCELTHGFRDPDCGCGNGTVAAPSNGLYTELCDGSGFATGYTNACANYGFTSGTVTCSQTCNLDFEQCF